MSFYKMSGQEMIFQLVNEQVREDFALWNNVTRTFVRQLEGVANINDIKFMKQDLFVQRYPSLRKTTQYVRDIVVYDAVEQPPSQYSFGFKKTANDDLNKAITNNKNLGVNPLEVLYKMRKTGQGLETTYAIVVLERIGLPQNVQQSSTSQNAPQPQTPYMQTTPKPMIVPLSVQKPVVPIKAPETAYIKPIGALQQGFELPKQVPNVQKAVALTEKEQVVYGKACEYSGTLSRSDFTDGFIFTYKKLFNEDIGGQRAIDIYDELYSK